MGEGNDAQPPEILQPPARKSPEQLAQESLQAQGSTAPGYLGLNRQMLPQYAQLYTDIQRQQAPQQLDTYLQNERTGRPQLIDMALSGMKQADPTGFIISEEVKQRVLNNLRSGGDLTSAESGALDQGIQSRLGKQGRGTGVGDAYSAEKLFANERFGREQTRIANAMGVLDNPQSRAAMQLQPNQTPFFNQVNGTDPFVQTGASGSQLFSSGLQQNEGAINDMNNWNNQRSNSYQLSKQYASDDPLAQWLGVGAGVIGTGVGAAFGTNGGSWMGGGGGQALGGGGANAATQMFASSGRSQPSIINDRTFSGY